MSETRVDSLDGPQVCLHDWSVFLGYNTGRGTGLDDDTTLLNLLLGDDLTWDEIDTHPQHEDVGTPKRR